MIIDGASCTVCYCTMSHSGIQRSTKLGRVQITGSLLWCSCSERTQGWCPLLSRHLDVLLSVSALLAPFFAVTRCRRQKKKSEIKNKSKARTAHKASAYGSQPTCGPTPWYRQFTTLSSRLISSFWLKSSSCCAAWSANIVIIAGIEICNKNSTGCSSECTKHIQRAKSCEPCVQKQFQTAGQPLNKPPCRLTRIQSL